MKILNYYRSVGQEIRQLFEPKDCVYRYKRYRVYAEIEAEGHLALRDAERLKTYLERIDRGRCSSSYESYYTQTEDKIIVRVFGFEIIDEDYYKESIGILDDIIALLKAA